MRCEAGMVALYHNAGTQMLEYEACKGGVAIPYSLHTNPINIGYPDSLGIGAAVIGDGNTDMVYEMAQTDRKMMKAEGLNIMYGPQVDVTSDPAGPVPPVLTASVPMSPAILPRLWSRAIRMATTA